MLIMITSSLTFTNLCADCLEALSRRVKTLADKGLSADDIRNQLIGKDTLLAALTEGGLSVLHVINSILRSQHQRKFT